ncbi:MAG: hypothetical protein RL695_708 [Pseudomonadota bacterium]|jgi:L-lactate dehydrogenase complex protein LldG
MNLNSRELILARLRERLGRNSNDQGEAVRQRAAIENYVNTHAAGPRASSRTLSADDLLTQFQEKALTLASTVDRVPTWAQIPAAVAQYLEQQGLPRQAVCWPELATLGWSTQGVFVENRPARGDDRVGITGCFAAVAETGTLVLCSGATTPATISLLPETHIAILATRRLVADMEAVWTLLRAEQNELPRAVNFVSGPSRTGDIEQTIVLGAHGPYRVHVIIVSEA